MAKRYTARVTMPLNTEGQDGNAVLATTPIDLAILHSQRMQRNVRQGHVFHLHKIQAALVPSGGDIDTGLAVSATARWCPATKNSAKAWRHLFNVWRKQKALKVGAIGPMVRYDDFELAYSADYITPRTSSLYTTGMEDSTTEHACIYGHSTDGDDVTLEDIFESLQTQPSSSRFPMNNSTVKPSKYLYQFPPEQIVGFGATYSTVAPSGNMLIEPDSGAHFQNDPVYIQDTSVLCGLVVLKAQALAEDIAGFTGDSLNLQVELTYSVGLPLAKVPRKGKGARMSRTWSRPNRSPRYARYKKQVTWSKYRK